MIQFLLFIARAFTYRTSQLWGISLLASACGVHTPDSGDVEPLRTEHVILVVIDGPRYSELWADSAELAPNLSGKLMQEGVFASDFYNDGYTYTNAGHAALTTGVNQAIDNYGNELPANPSIFQYYLKASGKPATAAWVVASKDKLDILGDTRHPEWQGTYQPSLNCGVNGPNTGYRMDSLTLMEAKRILATHRPSLMLLNFMEPDGYAHAGNWANYVRGIARNDRYIKQLWDFLKKDPFYKDKTTLLVTSDHGRHLDGVAEGWPEHGDHCAGCEHIGLLAIGPDFKKGRKLKSRYTLVDIAPTVAYLLQFRMDSVVFEPVPVAAVAGIAADTVAVGVQQKTLLKGATRKGNVISELFR